MNEGTYNNVIRSNSPFSPMTPSTPNSSSYKTNMNRTKTRKWVEAKVQSYDGDDWGNEYEDEYEEPEQPPASRVAELRQQYSASTLPSSRTFPQTAPDVSSNVSRSFGSRNPGGPPSLHLQTGLGSRYHPVEVTSSSAQSSASGLPQYPRQSSVDPPDVEASRPGAQPGPHSVTRSWTDPRAASPDRVLGNPSKPADRFGEEIEKEQRPEETSRPNLESYGGPGFSRGPRSALGPVDEQKEGYGTGLTASDTERKPESGLQPPNPDRLSTSPKLPDLARMSGFGDDFFSSSGKFSSFSPVSGSQQQAVSANTNLGSPIGLDDKRRDAIGLSGSKPPSVLGGPKLEPSPEIAMPPSESALEPKKGQSLVESQQSAPIRPHLPGAWVSESVSIGSGHPSSVERPRGVASAPSGGDVQDSVPPIGAAHAGSADIEPTTTLRQLPSAPGTSKTVAEAKAFYESRSDTFGRPIGEHDNVVASKVVASGLGYHPTPQSLPPLKTENSLVAASDIAQIDREGDRRQNEPAPPSSVYMDSSSQQSPSTQQSAASTGSGFTPTAPLNPHRPLNAPTDLVTPTIQQRKSTMSTIDTASPEKESDKLREEIIKSLSSSPAATSGDGAVLGSSHDSSDAAKRGPTRESTYLSDVYDDYLNSVEEKTIQETSNTLKQGHQGAEHRSGEALPASGIDVDQDFFPEIAPLSPLRNPEPRIVTRPRQFSWEAGPPEPVDDKLAETELKGSALSLGLDSANPDKNESTPGAAEVGATAPSFGTLQAQPEATGTVSHQVSKASSQAPGDPSPSELDPPSPISTTAERKPSVQAAVADASRLSFAEEKEKIITQSYSSRSSEERHPVWGRQPDLTLAPPPAVQSSSQAKIMAFRDILNIVSIEQRIRKFDETRTQFYSIESGLSNWVAYMQSQIDQGTAATLGSSLTPGRTSPPDGHVHPNANTQGAPTGQLGIPPTGNNLQPAIGFGSGNHQVGVKSKELLHAAGAFGNKGVKSGMKLFSKGKSKLRGTGDKVFF
ncbi:hypothetical protein GGS23DRAFT_598853 [Durotheca rogersii]|uniref:uncharacterized protein n=1 Tax=Durotheca rogersii TaxID=419775 RepID=UPI002220D228|nr:uncharacterized protein GGS23DRAFT_598853 [Durotheca rogersii]KAI5860966.1 hypothetical protein GGS23DRAFT_598853 [Durotheca rogersii]